MIYVIRSGQSTAVALLRTWDGRVTQSESVSGHWTWCVGRKVDSVLQWARDHDLIWHAEANESTWEDKLRELTLARHWERTGRPRIKVTARAKA